MTDRFPKDCWGKNCPHFHTRDLSIDDLVCTCDLLKIQCDACDEDWCFEEIEPCYPDNDSDGLQDGKEDDCVGDWEEDGCDDMDDDGIQDSF